MRSDSQDKLHFNSHCSIKVNSVNERESSQKFPCLYFLLPMGFPDLAKCYRMEPQILLVVGFMCLIQVFLNKVISIQASPNNYRLSLRELLGILKYPVLMESHLFCCLGRPWRCHLVDSQCSVCKEGVQQRGKFLHTSKAFHLSSYSWNNWKQIITGVGSSSHAK